MDNRFVEMDEYLQQITGRTSGNGSDSKSTPSSNGLENPNKFSISKSYEWARPMSAQDRVLVILIENGGVDLGIPELVDKIISALHLGSVIPDGAKQKFIELLKEKIKSITDNLLETAELSLNRYSGSSPEFFGKVDVLRNSSASYTDLKNKLITHSKDGKIIDL